MAPSEIQRASIVSLIAELEASLTAASEREIGTEFVKLLMAFPAQQLSETTARLRADAYFEALGDLPSWALRAACHRWLRGDVGDVHLAFAPSPPQLRKTATEEMLPCRAQLVRLRRLLDAQVLKERSAEDRAAMAQRIAGLVGVSAFAEAPTIGGSGATRDGFG